MNSTHQPECAICGSNLHYTQECRRLPLERAPSEPQAHEGRCAGSTGSVAGEKLTQRQFENLKACMSNKRRLEKLSPHQLIVEALNSDAADYDVTVELMNRVLPGWSDAPEGTYDEPQNNPAQTPEGQRPGGCL